VSAVFVHAFQGEWLKKKRSLASWLVVVGGVFTPAMVILARLIYRERLPQIYAADGFWTLLWKNSWESMAIFFLPMAAILATSLITQIEFKNNAWKQVHALPIGLATIFFSKLAVVLLMMVQFLIMFTIAIYLSALVPYLLVSGVPYPKHAIPYLHFLREALLYFVDSLPIVAAQYLISLRFKNFLVPVGVGFVAWVAALAALRWKFGFLVPYTYCMFNYLKDEPVTKAVMPTVNFHWFAAGYFILFTVMGFGLFVTKREKG
jgi:lantibiotic transport system permease protein